MLPTPATVVDDVLGEYIDDLLGTLKVEACEEIELDSTPLDGQIVIKQVSSELGVNVPTMPRLTFAPTTLNAAFMDGTLPLGDLDAKVPTAAFRCASLPTAYVPPALPHTPAPFPKVPTTAFRCASLPTAYVPPALPHTPAPFPDPIAFHVPDLRGGAAEPSAAVPTLGRKLPAGLWPRPLGAEGLDTKSAIRRLRNRKAAANSRERKKRHIKDLLESIEQLKKEVTSLKQDNQSKQKIIDVRVA